MCLQIKLGCYQTLHNLIDRNRSEIHHLYYIHEFPNVMGCSSLSFRTQRLEYTSNLDNHVEYMHMLAHPLALSRRVRTICNDEHLIVSI